MTFREEWEAMYQVEKNGWFDFQDIYDMAADDIESGTFVEIGVWQGMSLAYLVDRVKNKKITVWGIDTFMGDPNNQNEQNLIKNGQLNLLEITKANFANLGITNGLNLIIKDSIEAATMFYDDECDFVFIDGGHEYEQVIKDIEAWYPKVKPGRILAGHDINADSVERAVREKFPHYKRSHNSWYIRK